MKLTPVAQTQTDRPGVNGQVPVVTEMVVVEPGASTYQEPLIMSIYGEWGCGKSRFAGTAPGDIGLVPTDRKAKQTVLRSAAEFGRRVIMPAIDLVRVENPMALTGLPDACVSHTLPAYEGRSGAWCEEQLRAIAAKITLTQSAPACCKRHYFRWAVNRTKAVTFQFAANPEVRTIVIDTFGQFVEDCSYANYGVPPGPLDVKEFGFAPRQWINAEVREFLNAIAVKNCILVHQSADVWKNGVPVPGKTKPRTKFDGTGYYLSVELEFRRNEGVSPGHPGRYVVKVNDCQANAPLSGMFQLMDDDISFANIAMACYPESGPENWE